MSIDVAATPVQAPRPGVADRLTQILEVFLAQDGRLLLDDVCRATGLPRSTTFRMLRQLVDLHWLEHTDRGYRLGMRSRSLRTLDNDELRSVAAPVLNELHLRTGAVAHLAVLEGHVVHYLDKIGGAAAPRMPSRVGARLSPDRTVSGKTLLAAMPAEDIDTLLTIGPGRECTTAQLAELHRDLEQIRGRHGLAIDPAEQCGMGITAVAAPVYGRARVLGSISLASRDGAQARDLGPLVVRAARTISVALGHVPRRPHRTRRHHR